MAITQALCTSFKSELLDGVHDMNTDTFKIALYTSAATLDASTTAYSATNEVASGGGYTTGGNTLSGGSISTSGTTAFVDFSDTTWSGSTFTARGALIYNSSKSNKAVAVFDFGEDKIGSGGAFTIQFPTADATNALIRLK
jgi:hypothetical protein